jgi:hypothetical protein
MTGAYQAVTLTLVLAVFEVLEYLTVRKQSSEIFAPKLGWRLFYFVMIYASTFALISSIQISEHSANRSHVWWTLLIVFALLFFRPRTVVATPEGLASYSFYGLRRDFLPWPEVAAVASDWVEETQGIGGFWSLWVSMGYKITVVGREGGRIEHSIYLRKQARFLDDLRQHVPSSAFAPGHLRLASISPTAATTHARELCVLRACAGPDLLRKFALRPGLSSR